MTEISYGAVWHRAAANIASTLQSDLPEGEQLKRILGLGYFSQFASHASPDFNEAVVSWFERYLASRDDVRLADLPADLTELDLAPDATVVSRQGRKTSPDLLRYVAYAMLLARVWRRERTESTEILEIGGGYGGLARTLKCFCPRSRIWLTDIPESLRCSEIYLRAAFPDARIVWLDAGANGEERDVDFHLVPVAEARRFLAGRSFDLAINVWSFGEMPNPLARAWLKLLQQECRIEWLFTINSFMAPVTHAAASRAQIGDWLLELDERWCIEHFEIDPEVHRCPLIRNFPKGIGLLARRVSDEREIASLREAAARDAAAILREDWAGIAACEQLTTDAARPERMLEMTGAQFDAHVVSSRRIVALTDYIGHFNIESGEEGPFFRLWNDWRLNRNERSGALLVAYLAMVGKTDLDRKCTKEELFLLKRLQRLALHDEYAIFDAAWGRVAYGSDWLTDQEACDRALTCRSAGDLEGAMALWIKVAAAYPAHGDCWYQIALGMKTRGALSEAALCAAHAVHLGCSHYAAHAESLRNGCEATFAGSGVAAADRDAVAAFGAYFAGEPKPALSKLAEAKRRGGSETLAAALDQAASRYP